ncbi:MAG: ABC transporter permease [bacterium]
MSKFWVVFKREYAQVVKKKSFIVGLVLTPALMGFFVVLPTFLARMKSSSTEHLAVIDQSGEGIGAGFAQSLDEYLLEDEQTPYYGVDQIFELGVDDSEAFKCLDDSLRALINNKELKYFLVLKPGAQWADSNIYLVTNSDNFRTINRFERRLSDQISAIRLRDSDINLSVDSVLALTESVELPLRDTKGESIPFAVKYFSALIFVGLMFGMIISYGQMVMRTVIEEKNSRIMEVLVSSVSPFQLMLGKIAGLGAATFTQVAIWFVVGGSLFLMRGMLEVDPAIDRMVFDPVIVVFFTLFLVMGYLFYSTLFALIGSIVTSEKEAQNFIAPLSISMIIPFMVGIAVVQDPFSTLARVLSMVPLTAPTMMVMRVAFVAPTLTEYSLFSGIIGEALLSWLILSAVTLGMIWMTGKIFRVGILMYGKRATLPEIIKWIRY